jgi:hypothetical protein
MDEPKPKFEYTMDDSVNGLTINYRGYKSWWYMLIYLGLGCFLAYKLIDLLILVLSKPLDNLLPSLLVVFLFGLLLFVYLIIQMFVFALDALFDLEKVTIDDEHIQIEKSGFGSISRSKAISTKGKMVFFRTNAGQISFNKSKFIARLYGIGLLYTQNLNPMRCFLRGISEKEAIIVLEKIKEKYSQYEIYFRRFFTK